jgi:hypothetical protein
MLQAVPGHKPRYVKQRKVLHNQTRETTTAVEWLILLLHIWKVLVSKLDPKTSHPEVVRGFPQSLQENADIGLPITLQPLPSTHAQILIHYNICTWRRRWINQANRGHSTVNRPMHNCHCQRYLCSSFSALLTFSYKYISYGVLHSWLDVI